MYLLYFLAKLAQAPCQKKGDFFSPYRVTTRRVAILPTITLSFPNFPDSPNLPIQSNKKTDISFSVAIIAEISDFDSLPKIGFLFFLFLVSFLQDEIYFSKIFYSTAKFFVKSLIFFAPTFLVIHSYFPAHPFISLNAPPRRSKIETFGAPV